MWDLDQADTAELGPMLKQTTGIIREIVVADQVCCRLWPHTDGQPGHIRFVAATRQESRLGKEHRVGKAETSEIALKRLRNGYRADFE